VTRHTIQRAYTMLFVARLSLQPVRKNYSTLSRGSPYRARIAREIRRTSESEWKIIIMAGDGLWKSISQA